MAASRRVPPPLRRTALQGRVPPATGRWRAGARAPARRGRRLPRRFSWPYDITAILVMSTGPRLVPALPGLHRGANHPELGKELELQRLGEIRGAARTAGAGFVADHPFHGLEVMEAP